MTPQWRATVCQTPGIMWARYAQAIGRDKMDAWFGKQWPPFDARMGETVYVVRDATLSPRPFDSDDHPAAWLSLAHDQFEYGKVNMSRGVWPDQHGRGLGRFMRDYAEQLVRNDGGHSLFIEVYVANEQHLANVLRDPYWKMDRYLFNPPCYGFTHAL